MIVLFASGSGGHIEPALLLKERLQKMGASVELILGNHYPKVSDGKVLNIPRRKIMALLYFPFLCMYVMRYFFIKKPRIIIGFGGFQSLLVLLIFRSLGCKIAIYEHNLIIGRANAFLLPFVHIIFLIWEETASRWSPRYYKKVIFVRPLVAGSENLKEKLYQDRKFTIVIFGGSQGARFLNDLFIQFLQDFKHYGDIRIDLIAGIKFYPSVIKRLSAISGGVEYNIQDFCNDMGRYYTSGDFFITRAGAQTILELISYCRPALLIPYPYAQAHQLGNAIHLLRKKCCLVVRQDKAKREAVIKVISAVIRNRDILVRMSENLKDLRQKLFNNPGMEEIIVSRFL